MITNYFDVFFVEEYAFPKKIGKVDIQSIRNLDLKSLKNGGSDSKFSERFRSMIDKKNNKYFHYIREFIIPIEDKSRWLKILNELGLSNTKYVNRQFFKLDYLFKYTGIAVEIDSSLHDSTYDSARDIYLELTYGIKTVRIFENVSREDIDKLEEISKKIIKSKAIPESIIRLDVNQVKSVFDIINRDIELGTSEFYKVTTVNISKNNFISRYCKVYSTEDTYQFFLQEFEKHFIEYYNKNIHWL